MELINEIQLDFKDVLIQPNESRIVSRNYVDINRTFHFKNVNKSWTGYPVIAANMLTGTFEMARTLSTYNMLTALHKHHSVSDLCNFFTTEPDVAENTFYTMGISDVDYVKYKAFTTESGITPKFICIDVANGYMTRFHDFIDRIRNENSESIIMAGNVVCGDMIDTLLGLGVNICKVGIGSGGNCTTRRTVGVGRPQLSAIIDTVGAASGYNGYICSDGGCSEAADINIAFSAGAAFVMLGTMLSGTNECAGDIVEHNGVKYKKFFGMSSNSAMETFGKGKASYKASEGRTTLIPLKGGVSSLVEEIQGTTRSLLSYLGVHKLEDAQSVARLMRVNTRLNTSVEQYTIGD